VGGGCGWVGPLPALQMSTSRPRSPRCSITCLAADLMLSSSFWSSLHNTKHGVRSHHSGFEEAQVEAS
jgi:hypothetical protein